MKKILGTLILLAFVLSICPAILAQDDSKKLENEIKKLEAQLKKTKSPSVRAKIQTLINKDKEELAVLKIQQPAKAAEAPKPAAAAPQPAMPKVMAVKGGLAGGAGLIAADFMMPVGPMYLGGEVGYAIGNQFGIIDAAIKGVFSFGAPFVGLEVGYAGYSKDVKEVPGLSGTIKSGVGIGIIGGTTFGPIQVGLGYNTALGLRADAGYRMYL